MSTPWGPSRLEQRLLWWLRQILRFGVGGVGLMWEVFADRLQDPLALLVFGTIATATDVPKYAMQLIKQAREDKLKLEEEMLEQEQRQHGA